MVERDRLGADVVVLGGGTAGAVVARRLVDAGAAVLLVEAGPDYGPLGGGGWPAPLLDADRPPTGHDWGYHSEGTLPGRILPFERGKVLGGSSAVNGCACLWGHEQDYDGWAARGLPGWSARSMLPRLRRSSAVLGVRRQTRDELDRVQAAFLTAAVRAGLPAVDDLNDLSAGAGVAPTDVNVHDRVRINAAAAYLDPVRDSGRLRILPDTLVDHIVLARGRARGARVARGRRQMEVAADLVVVAAGVYGSPAILERSGVGDPVRLHTAGVPALVGLPGVGGNLHDHPAVLVEYEVRPELAGALDRAVAERGGLREEQVLLKAPSRRCESAFDLHLFPIVEHSDRRWRCRVMVADMAPLSRGSCHIRSADPARAPGIDHRFLSDPAGDDIAVLCDGIELLRTIVDTGEFDGLLGEEVFPGRATPLADAVRDSAVHYWHPVGTCAMGPDSDGAAVVEATGRLRGVEACAVVDASTFPVIPRANTMMPVLAAAEVFAEHLVA